LFPPTFASCVIPCRLEGSLRRTLAGNWTGAGAAFAWNAASAIRSAWSGVRSGISLRSACAISFASFGTGSLAAWSPALSGCDSFDPSR
jgi:hypothetical protein